MAISPAFPFTHEKLSPLAVRHAHRRQPEWDRQFRLWRQHGMDVPETVRHGSPGVLFETYQTVGYNYRMTEIQAAVGRKQLERLPALVEGRRTLAERYQALLADVPGVIAPFEPEWARSNWQSYCVQLPQGSDQHAVMQAMLDEDVSTRRGIMCTHRELAYAGQALRFQLPHSEQAQDNAILLPLYPQMTENDQRQVLKALAAAVASC